MPPVTWSSRHVSLSSHGPSPSRASPRRGFFRRGAGSWWDRSAASLSRGFPKGVDAVWQGEAATTSQQGVSTEMAPSGAALQTPQLAGTSAELVDASTEGVRIRRVAGLHHLEELQGAFPVPQHRRPGSGLGVGIGPTTYGGGAGVDNLPVAHRIDEGPR